MKRTLEAIALGLCGMLLAGGFTACDKEDSKKETVPSYKLSLTDPEDAQIVLNHDQTDVFDVKITTDAPQDKLKVVEKNGETWCDATVVKGDECCIRVTPGANTSEEDKTATFVVSVEGNDKVTPVEFTVIRRGTATEYSVSVSSPDIVEGEWGTLAINPAAATESTVTITVTTNAARWFLSDANQVLDDEYNPVEWYTLDKTSGRSGEKVTITFTPNTGVENRMTSLSFTYAEDSFDAVYVTVTQSAKPATTVSFMDENGDAIDGTELAIELGKDDAGTVGSFEMSKDGSVDLKVCAAGTSTPVDEDSQWLFVGELYGSLNITSIANATGAARAADVVVTSKDSDTVLFRFKVTQAGE